ncbi:lysosomal alpha-mannosidase [Anabrus simplex]|uniref:lysosomal alpha-mannosidase n=1 Tax=Anabrus simplex TaxID=316456 RepID=UPI0035A2BF37
MSRFDRTRIMMHSATLALLVALLAPTHAIPAGSKRYSKRNESCGYESCYPVKGGMLNVHLIPSSHLDLGWLKTVDQYYYGSKSWIHKVGVQYIFQSAVNELRNNPSRRFVIAEVAYLWRWWSEQPTARREYVKELVNTGRLEIVNGGWSMNDEALTTYQAVIDQFSWGFRRLEEMFGSQCSKPRIGWQVDPYGHSREMASLFSQFGFEGHFISRLGLAEKSARLQTRSMEFVWTPSPNLGLASNIFTSVLFNMHRAPDSYCFDILCKSDAVVDDIRSRDYNVDVKVQQFIDYCEEQAKFYRTDNIAIVMGDDFQYQSAPSDFINMDKLIRYVNAKQQTGSRVQVQYSTPSCYIKAVNNANSTWPVNEHDFFPYANDLHSYWTGYYTSRPNSKRMERVGNNYLQICKQLHVLAGLEEHEERLVNVMREAMGVMQHHDAITGTERQAVADDYHAMLHNGFVHCEKVIKTAFRKLSSNSIEDAIAEEDPGSHHFTIDSCFLRNISQCIVAEKSNVFVVTVYNPMSSPTTLHVRLPVRGKEYSVQDHNGDEILAQLVPVPIAVRNIRGRRSKAADELVFAAEDLPPLGFRSYYITKLAGGNSTVAEDTTDPNRIANEKIEVYLNSSSFLIQELVLPMINETVIMSQNFAYYKSDGSGSYIFRPANESTFVAVDCAVHRVAYKGDVVEEIHQTFSPWVSQVMRLYRKANYIELEWLVGPVDVNDDNAVGKDVISRFTTELDNQGVFYTDANGRELVKRKLNPESTEPIAGNYYPVPTRILIRDEKRGLELAVLTDRPQGGSSLRNGEIELGVHRRFLADDIMGLNEALNEEEYDKGIVARGKHYVFVGKMDTSSKNNLALEERNMVQKVVNGPWAFVTPADNMTFQQWSSTYIMEFRGLKDALPPNVHVLSLEPWKDHTILLRLEHIMESGEDEDGCRPVVVNIQDMFTPFPVFSIQEMKLGANQPCDTPKMEWGYKRTCGSEEDLQNLCVTSANTVTLKPMQIRTFIIDVKT